MIDKTIKNIKKYFKTLKKILTAKISEKKCFTRFLEEIFTAKTAVQKKNCFVFPIHKSIRYKK